MPHRTHPPLVRVAALVLAITGAAIAVPAAATDRVVIVQPGDTLSEIAMREGLSLAQLRALNGIADPNRIYAGQRLRITGDVESATPAVASAPRIHVVTRGQTLTAIARLYGSTIAAIVKANGITKPSLLRVGQRLTIPGGTAPAPAGVMPASIASPMAARADVAAIIRAQAKAHGVPAAFALAVAWQESGWRANVVSRAGAVGVMQLTPTTADWVATTMLGHGIKLHDAHSNIEAGVVLLRHYLDRYHGDRNLTLAAYYQGQTAADRHGVYRMTRPYIASILALEKLLGS